MKKTVVIDHTHFDSKLSYLREIIEYRIKKEYTNDESSPFPVFEDIIEDDSSFSAFAKKNRLNK